MKALRVLLMFCLTFALVAPTSIYFGEEAYAAELEYVGESHVEGSFSFVDHEMNSKKGAGYTYDVEYSIKATAYVDRTIGPPGYVGFIWDVEGSTMTFTNTTPGKKAPDIALMIVPRYDKEAAIAIYGEVSILQNHYAFRDKLYINGYCIGDDNVQVGLGTYYIAGAWANGRMLSSGVGVIGLGDANRENGWVGIGDSATYGLEFILNMSGESNGTTRETIIIREDAVDFYANPIGWSFTPNEDIHYAPIPETYIYEPDAFEAERQAVDLVFDVNSTNEVNISDGIIKTAALECAVTYKSDEEVKALLGQLGWKDVEMFDKDTSFQFFDHSKYWLGHQTRSDGVEVVSILLKGTDGYREWFSQLLNLRDITRDDPDHFGFRTAAGDVISELTGYIDRYGLERVTTNYLIRGHSRGAAVGNVVAKELSDIHGKELVKAVLLATPNVYWDSSGDPSYTNILNIEDGGDIVTKLPPGGSKNGVIKGYYSSRNTIKSFYDIDSLWGGSFGAEDIFWTHTPENYLARIMSDDPQDEWNSSSWQMIAIHCATDLEILDQNHDHDLVASITDNIVGEDNKYLILTNDAGEKTVLLPTDGQFVLRVIATDDTQVEYSYSLIENSGLIEVIPPKTFDLASGDVYFAMFNDGNPALADLEQENSSVDSSTGSGINTTPIVIIIAGAAALVVIIAIICVLAVKRRKKHGK